MILRDRWLNFLKIDVLILAIVDVEDHLFPSRFRCFGNPSLTWGEDKLCLLNLWIFAWFKVTIYGLNDGFLSYIGIKIETQRLCTALFQGLMDDLSFGFWKQWWFIRKGKGFSGCGFGDRVLVFGFGLDQWHMVINKFNMLSIDENNDTIYIRHLYEDNHANLIYPEQ